MQEKIQFWKVKTLPLRIRTYEEARKQALQLFSRLRGNSKRKCNVKSIYFKKQKIFFDNFWDHLFQKPIAQRKARLRFLPCGIELLKMTTYAPSVKRNPNNRHEKLFRFYGKTVHDEFFAIQIKQGGKALQCMSVFKTKKPR